MTNPQHSTDSNPHRISSSNRLTLPLKHWIRVGFQYSMNAQYWLIMENWCLDFPTKYARHNKLSFLFVTLHLDMNHPWSTLCSSTTNWPVIVINITGSVITDLYLPTVLSTHLPIVAACKWQNTPTKDFKPEDLLQKDLTPYLQL